MKLALSSAVDHNDKSGVKWSGSTVFELWSTQRDIKIYFEYLHK